MSSQSIQDIIHSVRKGFAYPSNGFKVDGAGFYTTVEEAEQAAREVIARREAAEQTAPKLAAAATVDRQAMRVARMVPSIGAPSPKATGRCHYCNQPLTGGYCEECV